MKTITTLIMIVITITKMLTTPFNVDNYVDDHYLIGNNSLIKIITKMITTAIPTAAVTLMTTMMIMRMSNYWMRLRVI